jgi:hypothetical protein
LGNIHSNRHDFSEVRQGLRREERKKRKAEEKAAEEEKGKEPEKAMEKDRTRHHRRRSDPEKPKGELASLWSSAKKVFDL